MLQRIAGINAGAPATISTSFTADGVSGGQKFKLEGTARFDRKGYYSISVLDYVFRSRVLDAYRSMDTLYFFYPAEKRLLIDDIKSIDIYRYTGFKTEFSFLFDLLTGGVPLITGGTIARCVPGDGDSCSIVVENSDYMQSIFMKAGIPEKIMLVHRLSKDRLEIYLKSHITRDNCIFFTNIRIVAPERNISVNIKFSGTALNGAVKVESFNPGSLKKGTEIIRVN